MQYPSQLLIGGILVDGQADIDVIDPATGAVFTSCGQASEMQLDLAAAAARQALPAWAVSPVGERQAALVRIADALAARADAFAELLVREQGKTLAEAVFEVSGTIDFFRYFATQSLPGEVIEDSDRRYVRLEHRPVGVVGAIVPWNYPLVLMGAKVAPALLVGNTIVIKPAPTTPLTALMFGALVRELVPAGVINVVADGGELGQAMTGHPGIDKISFTGSTETGRRVMARSAATLKRVTLELGGNDAAIVCDDVDPAEVARSIFAIAFPNAGQLCMAIKRAYVPECLYDDFCTAMAALANAAIVGSGLDPTTTMGPVQNRKQYDRVHDLIDDARAHGTIIAGGGRDNRDGYFIEPTIVRDIDDRARLVVEEQFGPVLPIIKVASDDDAVARANASEFGLGASVWSSNTDRGVTLAARLEAGAVWVNKHSEIGPNLPLAGAKQSGIGAEFGRYGLLDMTQIRTINCGPRANSAQV